MKNATNSLIKCYSKLSNIGKILVFICLALIIIYLFKCIELPYNQINPALEGFITNDNYIFINDNVTVFDEFYSNIYDSLVFSDIKATFETGVLLGLLGPSSSAIVLDIGSGTGHFVDQVSKNKKIKEIVGIDISPAMIEQSKKLYPNHKWILGNALSSNHQFNNTFTHITCLYFTIYYFQDKTIFLQNAYDWLLPGGYLLLHLVNPLKFDPILPPGNPLLIVSPQKYAKDRITSTKVKFKDFDYKANFEYEGPKASFKEKFTFNNGKVREQQHNLYMEDTDTITNLAQQTGFILHSIVDMVKATYENQYIYIFSKPN